MQENQSNNIQIVVHEGRGIRLDLSEQPKTFKDTIRNLFRFGSTHRPKVIESWYENSPCGDLRQRVARHLDCLKKQKLDRPSERAIQRDVIRIFRDRYPRTKD